MSIYAVGLCHRAEHRMFSKTALKTYLLVNLTVNLFYRNSKCDNVPVHKYRIYSCCTYLQGHNTRMHAHTGMDKIFIR